MYKLIRPIIFKIDAEIAHDMLVGMGERIPVWAAKPILNRFYQYENPILESTVCGIRFPNPIGLAAGFDKDAKLLDILPGLGFGFIEIGAVTPRPQQGNLKPRLLRMPDKKALVNRMGFNNDGLDVIAERLKRRGGGVIVGANIGKNKDIPNEKAADEYAACFQKLQNLVDYIAVNVSSPNTEDLRALQDKKAIFEILNRLRKLQHGNTPILLKISPELEDWQLDDIVDAVKQAQIAGIIATNTLKSEQGGVSGEPLREHSTQVIQRVYKKSNGKIPIVGVGGIFSGKDAYEKITFGASLVQVYTGLVYEGPNLIKRIKKDLEKLLKADGFTNITQAIGTKA